MRPIEVLAEAPAAEFRIHLQSPPPLPPPVPPARCDGRTCPWWPYSDSKDFRTNASIILIILFSLLLCVLALVAVIRYFLRAGAGGAADQQQQLPKAADLSDGADGKSSDFPTVQVFVRGMKLAGEGECTICLSEFVEGDGIKVLDRCNHGFHFECIRIWLDLHSSCPTCRSDCLPTPPGIQ